MNTPDPTSDDEFGSEPPGPDLEAAEYALKTVQTSAETFSQSAEGSRPPGKDSPSAQGSIDGATP